MSAYPKKEESSPKANFVKKSPTEHYTEPSGMAMVKIQIPHYLCWIIELIGFCFSLLQ